MTTDHKHTYKYLFTRYEARTWGWCLTLRFYVATWM